MKAIRKRIYIACPVTKGHPQKNAARADDVACALMSRGFAVLNPALTMWAGAAIAQLDDLELPYPDAQAHGPFRTFSHDEWILNGLAWIAAADAVYRVPGESLGADEECRFALSNGVPVFFTLEELFLHFKATKPLVRADEVFTGRTN